MIGERVFPHKYGALRLPELAFGRDLRGCWWVRPPGEDARKVSGREVVEHADGTITLVQQINGGTFCGFLERGVWRQT